MKTLTKAIAAFYVSAALGCLPVFSQQSPSGIASDTAPGASLEIAERGGPGGEHHGWHHGPKLTDDQLQKLADIRESLHERTAAQHMQMHALEHQLHKLFSEPTVDKTQALAIQAKINALHDELANAKLSSHIDAIGVFTPEQRAEIRHFWLTREAFGGHRGGGHHRGGHGCEKYEGHGGWHHEGGHPGNGGEHGGEGV
jgi:Spy/CpxP family protein refolding chaperone